MFAFIFEWILPIIAVALLIPAFYCNDRRDYGESTACMLASLGLAGWVFWDSIVPYLGDNKIYTIAKLSAMYIGVGVVTAFIYWVFYIWKARERFDACLVASNIKASNGFPFPIEFSSPSAVEAYRKYVTLKDHRNYIFDGLNPSLREFGKNEIFDGSEDMPNSITVKYSEAVAEVLPPRFSVCKSYVVGAGLSWPITLVWLLAARVVKQLIERIVSMFGGTFDRISRFAFGKI